MRRGGHRGLFDELDDERRPNPRGSGGHRGAWLPAATYEAGRRWLKRQPWRHADDISNKIGAAVGDGEYTIAFDLAELQLDPDDDPRGWTNAIQAVAQDDGYRVTGARKQGDHLVLELAERELEPELLELHQAFRDAYPRMQAEAEERRNRPAPPGEFRYERRDKNPEFFTDGRGIPRPIRGTDGWGGPYDEAIAQHARHGRVLREREDEAGRYERAASLHGASSDWVIRPPWAGGITNNELAKIAHTYGVSAGQDAWWERVHLLGRTGGKMSGELRDELEAGQHRGPRRGKVAARPRSLGRPATVRERAASRRQQRDDHADLPW